MTGIPDAVRSEGDVSQARGSPRSQFMVRPRVFEERASLASSTSVSIFRTYVRLRNLRDFRELAAYEGDYLHMREGTSPCPETECTENPRRK
jgi:hypothetical protein